MVQFPFWEWGRMQAEAKCRRDGGPATAGRRYERHRQNRFAGLKAAATKATSKAEAGGEESRSNGWCEEADIAAGEDATSVWRVSGAAGYGRKDTRRVARAAKRIWSDASEVSADGDFVPRGADDDGDRGGETVVHPAESGIHFETAGRAGLGATRPAAASRRGIRGAETSARERTSLSTLQEWARRGHFDADGARNEACRDGFSQARESGEVADARAGWARAGNADAVAAKAARRRHCEICERDPDETSRRTRLGKRRRDAVVGLDVRTAGVAVQHTATPFFFALA